VCGEFGGAWTSTWSVDKLADVLELWGNAAVYGGMSWSVGVCS